VTPTEDVRLLLRFLADVQPGARIGHLGDLPGVAPSSKIPCPDCAGKGTRRVRLKAGRKSWRDADGALVASCEPCEGRGWRIVDDYTGDDVGSEETAARSSTRQVFCDGCGGLGAHGNGKRCRHCDGAGSVAIPSDSTAESLNRKHRDGDVLAVALRAGRATGQAGLWAAGSFAALERALSELTPPMRWRAYKAYVSYEAEPEPDLLRILAARVRKIERGKIRVPAELRRWAEGQGKRCANSVGLVDSY